MLEKISRMAEQAATSVSRRQFLNRLGVAAAGMAAALGGLLLLPGRAEGRTEPCVACTYLCPDGSLLTGFRDKSCPHTMNHCKLIGAGPCGR